MVNSAVMNWLQPLKSSANLTRMATASLPCRNSWESRSLLADAHHKALAPDRDLDSVVVVHSLVVQEWKVMAHVLKVSHASVTVVHRMVLHREMALDHHETVKVLHVRDSVHLVKVTVLARKVLHVTVNVAQKPDHRAMEIVPHVKATAHVLKAPLVMVNAVQKDLPAMANVHAHHSHPMKCSDASIRTKTDSFRRKKLLNG